MNLSWHLVAIKKIEITNNLVQNSEGLLILLRLFQWCRVSELNSWLRGAKDAVCQKFSSTDKLTIWKDNVENDKHLYKIKSKKVIKLVVMCKNQNELKCLYFLVSWEILIYCGLRVIANKPTKYCQTFESNGMKKK